MPSLLGNGKLNSSMDTLGSPTILDGCLATKNGGPLQEKGRCFVLDQPDVMMEASIEVSLYPLISGGEMEESGRRRRSTVEDSSERVARRIQEAASAKVFPVIVI
jgi:hypothetical protein